MHKDEYIAELRLGLRGLPEEELARAVEFYEEAIEDRMEAGASEGEAVASMEAPEQAAERILAELPPAVRAAMRLNGYRASGARRVAAMAALVLGSPIWLALLVAAAAAVAAVFVALVAVLLCVWVVVALLLLGAPVGVWAAVLAIESGAGHMAPICLGIGLVVSALGILAVQPAVLASRWLSHGIAWLVRKVVSLFTPRVKALEWSPIPTPSVWRATRGVVAVMAALGLVLAVGGWGWAGATGRSIQPVSMPVQGQLAVWFGKGTVDLQTPDPNPDEPATPSEPADPAEPAEPSEPAMPAEPAAPGAR